MILETTGNLLEASAEALVNTVNTDGVMGKGIALQFARAFPDNLKDYEAACRRSEVRPGQMFITENRALKGLNGPRWLINFPTKRHWRARSRIEDVESGLAALIQEVRRLGIKSIAVPPLGCGNGGLNWADVRPMIEQAFAAVPEVSVQLYSPQTAPTAEKMQNRTARPRLTAAVASTVGILARYVMFDDRLTLLEVQKLVYFLKAAGEPMERTVFAKSSYGPYADSLRHVLNRLEGHFLSGWGDGTKNQPETPIHLLPEAEEEAEKFLREQPATLARFDKVAKLIEGFETPYGLELLSSVHWVATQEGGAARNDAAAAVAAVRAWSPRKRDLFKEAHLRLAWKRLHSTGWLA